MRLWVNQHGRSHLTQWYMNNLKYTWPSFFYSNFWFMPDSYIKYWFLKLLRRKPLWYWDAEEIFYDYVPGLGVYMSDGVYSSLSSWVIMQGFTPMWKEDGPSYKEDK